MSRPSEGENNAAGSHQPVTEHREEKITAIDVFDNGDSVSMLVNNGDKAELVNFVKPPKSRNHRFYTLEGLFSYINSIHCQNQTGVLFVGQNEIDIDLAYGENKMDWSAKLLLLHAEEFSALMKLTRGVSQKELEVLLKTSLYDCIPPDLLLAISHISVSNKSDCDVKITPIGTTKASMSSGVNISFADKSGQSLNSDLRLDWEYTGRIWECYQKSFTIKLRLDVSYDERNGLTFTFHPRRLSKVNMDAREDMIGFINEHIPSHFTVYEGVLGGN